MKQYKKNYFVYFYSYLAVQVIFVFAHAYLPVYFLNVLDVNLIQLATIQLFSYPALFIKPIIAIFFDKKEKHYNLKFIIVLSAIGVIISFILFLNSLSLLIIFGIFLSINFATISIMDVAVDKTLITNSPDEKTRNTNIIFVQVGSFIGAMIPYLVYYITFPGVHTLDYWNFFFITGIIAVLPLILIIPLLGDIEDLPEIQREKNKNEQINKRSVILFCMYFFLVYSDKLYEYPLEPWIIAKYGNDAFSLYSLVTIIYILINGLTYIIAGILMKRLNEYKVLKLTTALIGVLLIIIAFSDLFSMIMIFGVIQVLAGFLIVSAMSITIKLSQKKVAIYQGMVSFIVLASVVFIPLGTFLYSFISTETIFAIVGMLTLASVIPLLFVVSEK